jgi:histidyl-tRNA synthetase
VEKPEGDGGGELDVHSAGPAEAAKWRFVRRRAFAVFQSHGYREVQPAPLEPAGTAARASRSAWPHAALAVDAATELRSDPVVSIARVYNHDDGGERFARLMTSGNVFDPEPEGPLRFRAWHAVSGLVLGAADPGADAEVAALCGTLAQDAGLADFEVVLGTLGDPGELERFLDATVEHRPLRCAACRGRSAPLRFLTCADEGCRALAAAAPPLRDFIGVAALKHHEAVLATLEASGFRVRDEPRLGFGAGRYQRTLIELRARALTLPDRPILTLARGGRRDGLIAALGGRAAPAVGLTVGVARAAACAPGEGEAYHTACELFIAARGAAARAWALKTAAGERARGFRVDVELRELGWAEQLKRAERVRARVVIVVGELERKNGQVAIRDMASRETRHIPEASLAAELKRLLR